MQTNLTKKFVPNKTKKDFKKKNDVPLTRRQKIKKTLNWLFKNYPKVFKRKFPKPVKIGLYEDLLELKKPWMEKGILKAAIRSYVYGLPYLSCLIHHEDRFDLNGKKSGTVEAVHKEFAQKKIMEGLAKAKKVHDGQ